MATCIAAYGADVTIKNPLNVKPITVENFVGATEMRDLYPKSQVTDQGMEDEATNVSLTLLGIAAASEVMAHKMAYDEYRLAQREADLAKDVWRRYSSTYVPAEKKLAAYFMVKLPLAIAANNLRADYEQFLTQAWGASEAQFRRYRTCPLPTYARNVAWATAILNTDVKNLSKDTSETRDRDMWVTWFNRRAMFLNLGQDILSASSAYIQSSMGLLAENRNTFSNIAQGAGYMAGYVGMNKTLEDRKRKRETGISGNGTVGAQIDVGSTQANVNQAFTPEVEAAYGLDAGFRNQPKLSINDQAGIEAQVPPGGTF